MTRLFKPSDLNKRGQFGSVETVTNPNTGSSTRQFVASFSRWYAVRTRTMNQTYQIYGTDLQDTVDIVVRHDPSIKPPLLFQDSQSNQYNIVSVSPGETSNPNAFDILTLKATVRKGTNKNG
ncbi:phage head closure protein [Oenococcus oeni]|uniref:phage head closure protein n=1 Tax=Oenococcus oeni TaxID=1247 RepID=UPI00050DA517|nr:phage head closure protein [Oenococcus oeni]KGH57007.1 phage head-tail adapter protein [Oenococcus oeni IOEB_B10]